jgi:hypothetical protein
MSDFRDPEQISEEIIGLERKFCFIMEDMYFNKKAAACSMKLLSNEDLIELRQCNVLFQQAKRMMKKETSVFSTSSTTLGTKISYINFKKSDELINMIEEGG